MGLPAWVVLPFYALGILALINSIRHKKHGMTIQFAILMIGATLNLVAVASNHWMMPVLNGSSMYPDWIHVKMNPATVHCYWLCDVLWGKSSIGDHFILASLIVGAVVVIRGSIKDKRRLTTERCSVSN